jgi:polysaccharide biosynthesis protein PslH
MRTYGIARALAMHGPVTVLYARFGAMQPDAAYRTIPGIELREVVPSRGIARALAYAKARLTGVPDGFARGVSPELATAAATLASALDCARVIADGPTVAAALMRLARRRPVVYNAHNLESSFRHELGREERGKLRGLSSFEARLLRGSSESWMVSEADMRAARELAPGARLYLVPNVVDVAAIEPVFSTPTSPSPGLAARGPGAWGAKPEPASGLGSEREAIFVANFAYEPNRTALAFLLEEVFPRVWRELPDACLLLAGAGLEHPPSNDPRVRALGFVDDLAGAYRQASCAVVPLLQGGGYPARRRGPRAPRRRGLPCRRRGPGVCGRARARVARGRARDRARRTPPRRAALLDRGARRAHPRLAVQKASYDLKTRSLSAERFIARHKRRQRRIAL